MKRGEGVLHEVPGQFFLIILETHKRAVHVQVRGRDKAPGSHGLI